MKALLSLLLLSFISFSSISRAEESGGVRCEASAYNYLFGYSAGSYSSCYSCRDNNRGDRNIECRQTCTRTSFECSVSKFDVNSGGTSFTARGDSEAAAESQARALCEMSVAGSTTSFCIASASCRSVEESLGSRSCR